jgi:hypothetical protein
MLGFMSFFAVLAILSGTTAFIVSTIRGSADAILAALIGTPATAATVTVLPRRAIRARRPAATCHAQLRAAA